MSHGPTRSRTTLMPLPPLGGNGRQGRPVPRSRATPAQGILLNLCAHRQFDEGSMYQSRMSEVTGDALSAEPTQALGEDLREREKRWRPESSSLALRGRGVRGMALTPGRWRNAGDFLERSRERRFRIVADLERHA